MNKIKCNKTILFIHTHIQTSSLKQFMMTLRTLYSIQLREQRELQDWRPPPTIASKYSKCHGPNQFPINLTFHRRLNKKCSV